MVEKEHLDLAAVARVYHPCAHINTLMNSQTRTWSQSSVAALRHLHSEPGGHDSAAPWLNDAWAGRKEIKPCVIRMKAAGKPRCFGKKLDLHCLHLFIELNGDRRELPAAVLPAAVLPAAVLPAAVLLPLIARPSGKIEGVPKGQQSHRDRDIDKINNQIFSIFKMEATEADGVIVGQSALLEEGEWPTPSSRSQSVMTKAEFLKSGCVSPDFLSVYKHHLRNGNRHGAHVHLSRLARHHKITLIMDPSHKRKKFVRLPSAISQLIGEQKLTQQEEGDCSPGRMGDCSPGRMGNCKSPPKKRARREPNSSAEAATTVATTSALAQLQTAYEGLPDSLAITPAAPQPPVLASSVSRSSVLTSSVSRSWCCIQ